MMPLKIQITKTLNASSYVILALLLYGLNPVMAQDKSPIKNEISNKKNTNSPDQEVLNSNFDELEKGTKLRTGSLNFLRYKNYRRQFDGSLDDIISIRLDFNFSDVRMLNEEFGLGYKALGSLFFAKNLQGVEVTQVALGPILRYYIYNKEDFLIYGQGNLLAGQLELGDTIGGVEENFRIRKSLRLGATYRLSNSLGIYLETGPDWEGENIQSIDSQAFGFQVGIKFFKF